jgi:hypothetical protein
MVPKLVFAAKLSARAGIGTLGIWVAFAGFAGGLVPIGLVGVLLAAVTVLPLLVSLFPRSSNKALAVSGARRWWPFAVGVIGVVVVAVAVGGSVGRIKWDHGDEDAGQQATDAGDGTTVNCFHSRCETWPDTEGLRLRRALSVLDDFGYSDVVVTAVDADYRTIGDDRGLPIDADDESHLDWVVVTQTLPDTMLGSSYGPARLQVQEK